MTILVKAAEKLLELDKRIEEELPTAEIKSFFILRHLNIPPVAKIQQYIIKEWEPRVSSQVKPLSMLDYTQLRKWLGVDRPVNLPKASEPKKPLIKNVTRIDEDELFEYSSPCGNYYYDEYFYEGE